MSLSNSDDNEHSIHFNGAENNEFEYMGHEEEEEEIPQHGHENDENAANESYYIEIEDTDFVIA